MKKLIIAVCVLALLASVAPSLAKPVKGRGGVPAFFVGCCWGIREGSEWNEGKDLHWREWCRLVPLINFVIAVWDGYECYQGITSKEFAQQYGTNWY